MNRKKRYEFRRLPFCDPVKVCEVMEEYDKNGYDVVSLQPCSNDTEYFIYVKKRGDWNNELAWEDIGVIHGIILDTYKEYIDGNRENNTYRDYCEEVLQKYKDIVKNK